MNYKEMSREDEANLVPDWASIRQDYRHLKGYYAIDGDVMLHEVRPIDSKGEHLRISKGWVMDASMVTSLSKVLAFFAATGRLPRRLDSGVKS